ncbi:probable caffeoyl-CoA O-methyltransferase 2 isoform X2 [Penaeus chinensis]|uniref:probable caffeoyl-CoA O-methyltransferase 2 isoform X2 n=1 Tax=Penaeus chinensis TaxID=139456 RepID=UPI001FB7106D|nr:probable caffeoyl-CoA O-methyltransferase 2 isoform X2 [Penaeus chinensis]
MFLKMSCMKSYRNADPLVQYCVNHSLRLTDVQKRLNDVTLQHRRSSMLGAPEVLQLNANIMQAIGAKKVLDIGVFTGASSLSAALALPPDGKVHALDISEEFTNIGKPFWEEAGVINKISLHIAPAAETLQKFIDAGEAGTFDYAFIDADKESYDRYYELCLILLRSGGVIAFDNTLWDGTVIDPNDQTPDTLAIRKINEKLKDDQRINISFLKIGDGLSLCFKK